MNALFNKALAQNELMEYLGGFPGYRIPNPMADTPTDPDQAFAPIRDRIFEDESLKEKTTSALLALAATEYGWMVMYYLHELRILEKQNSRELMTDDFVASIAELLRSRKAEFESSSEWLGADVTGGLWGVILGMNAMMAEDYDLVVLPEAIAL